jgi:hypothetical protein
MLKYPSKRLVHKAADDLCGTLIPLTFNRGAFSFMVHLSCGLLVHGSKGMGGKNSLSNRHQKIQGDCPVTAKITYFCHPGFKLI